MREVPAGTSAEATFWPETWHTAAAIGNEGVRAVSTPAILGFLEQTSLEALRPYQTEDEISVGAHISLDHVGPAFLSEAVLCRASVEHAEGRRITFAVEAEQGGRAVARGRYLRVVLSAERFYGRQSGEAARTGAPIEFWFDVHSPWSYLAATRLPAVAARHARPIRWIPIHLARLNEEIGGRRPLDENPAFVRWYQQDLQDWAERTGLTIRYHPQFPLRPARALRMTTYAIEEGRGPECVSAVMRAYWTESRDISDLDVLGNLAASAGLEPHASRAAALDERYKALVEAATRAAIENGVFGVPSFRAEGKLFFGNDRLDLLDEFLTKCGRAFASELAQPLP